MKDVAFSQGNMHLIKMMEMILTVNDNYNNETVYFFTFVDNYDEFVFIL